ncbi:MAG TPA: V-type ATP synthase subunit E [Gemmatimonadales bacterium]|nr:V-type ATP synthase subunit E [Gemmatimonadales bacterium]
MALDHLLAALERDATAQAEALRTEARATVAAVTREADERVAQRRRDALVSREAAVRQSTESALADARHASRRRMLDARQRLLDHVFAAAHVLFAEAVNGAAYRAVLPHHIAEALEAAGDEPALIRCPEALVPVVQPIVASQARVTVRGDPGVPPGLVVTTTDGAIEVDQTLDGRLERLRARLALAVMARLGEGGGTGA